MRVVVALDSFKGSLSSVEGGNAVAKGIKRAVSNAEVQVCPVADGGEGTVFAMSAGCLGRMATVEVTGPTFEKLKAEYCIMPDGVTAVVEMAAAAGLPLVPAELRNPMNTTTFGVGELIADGISRGCRRFIVGIGGSATNDGGVGMLSALGFGFYNKNGEPIRPTAGGLESLARISADGAMPELGECSFRVACDVTNPLCGEKGCSAVFAPQKGASAEDILKMDGWLKNYAGLAKKLSPKADETHPGAGAAGGLGFAFLSFLNASLESGIGIVLDETGLEEKIKNSDIVVTGEGRLDGQSAMGKAPVGIAALGKKHGKRVIAFAGGVTEDAEACNTAGIDAFFPIVRGITTLEEALRPENAEKNLEAAAYQVFRLIDFERNGKI
ncbi:MAG: glycerate kinase [Clostridia bacterium]|nr:glycerate kinase [Clostridia bacterium]